VRGKIFSVIIAIALTGIPITSWVARALVTTGHNGWRYIFIWGSLGILVLPVARRKLSESPRWLFQRGRAARAELIVAELETAGRQRHGSLAPLAADYRTHETAILGSSC
jgi:putative MFS transporter